MPIKNEITVVVGKDKVKATARGGAARTGPVKLERLRLATIRVFEELLLDDKIQNRRHMEVLGQHLYAAILDGDVGLLIDEKLAEVDKDRLRLQLQFEPDVDREIASLPWEFLYSPTRAEFLATDVNLVLSRYLELGFDRELFPEEERPLRALVVISRPSNERPVLAKEVVAAIRDLNIEGHEAIVDVKVVEHTTLQAIEDALREHQPHIFHFIGHGNYNPTTRTGYLSLINSEDSTSEHCDDSTLIERFKNSQCFPRLVFLHMCEGGLSEKDLSLQAFSGFAPKLIHAKIPSVVAMQYPIKNEHARDFSKNFYQALADGASVDEAVQEGRRRLDMYRRSRVFGTPILYMHSASTLIMPKQRRSDPNKSNVPSEQKTDAPGDTSVPTQVTETTSPLEAAPDVLELVISRGFQAAKMFPVGENRARLRKHLIDMNVELKGKTRTDIFNAVFEAWESEGSPEIKAVWYSIMQDSNVL